MNKMIPIALLGALYTCAAAPLPAETVEVSTFCNTESGVEVFSQAVMNEDPHTLLMLLSEFVCFQSHLIYGKNFRSKLTSIRFMSETRILYSAQTPDGRTVYLYADVGNAT